eukprot:Skav214516  [mRNA]  locus=scaffold410:48117:51833:+ [translate_table: standard]
MESAAAAHVAAAFLTVSFESVKILAEHCAKMGNTFCLSLSAPYVCRYFGDRILTVIPYTDVIFGCERDESCDRTYEASGLGHAKQPMTAALQVATWLAKMPRSDGENWKRRHVAGAPDGASSCVESDPLEQGPWEPGGVHIG